MNNGRSVLSWILRIFGALFLAVIVILVVGAAILFAMCNSSTFH